MGRVNWLPRRRIYICRIDPSQRELIAELRRLADRLGHPPRDAEIERYSTFHTSHFESEFGSLAEAHSAAELPERTVPIPEEPLTGELTRDTDPPSHTDLLQDLFLTVQSLGHPPTPAEVAEVGVFDPDHFVAQFGSLSAAVERVTEAMNDEFFSTEGMLEHLRDIAEHVRRRPLAVDVVRFGYVPLRKYAAYFESWPAAMTEAGFPTEAYTPVSREDLVQRVAAIAQELGRPPVPAEVDEQLSHSALTHLRRFGTWGGLLRAAGCDADLGASAVADERRLRLALELRRVAAEHEVQPTVETVAQHGRYPIETFQRTFLTWTDALTAGGIEPDDDRARTALMEEEWVEAFQSVPTEAGERTSFDDVIASGVVEPRALFDKYSSWTMTLQRAGAVPREPEAERRMYPHDVDDLLLEDLLRIEENLDPFGVLYDDLDRVADEIGGCPRPVDVELLGQFSATTYTRAAGSWNAVLEEAATTSPPTDPQPGPGQRRAALLTALERTAVKRGVSPTAADLDTWTTYTSTSYAAAFGAVDRAVDLSGVRVEDPSEYATDALEAELQRIGAEFGHRPPDDLFDRLSPYGVDAYERAYDSVGGAWRQARWSATEGVPRETGPSDPEPYRRRLLSAVAELPTERFDDVTPVDVAKGTTFSPESYIAFFGSWPAVRAAARSVKTGRSTPSESDGEPEDVRAVLTEVAEELGRPPTPHEIHSRTSYTYPEVHEMLDGSIESVVGDLPANDGDSAAGPTAEDTQEVPAPDDVIAHLWDVAAESGNPSRLRPEAYETHGQILVETVQQQFGSFRAAVEAAGLQPTGAPEEQRTWYPPLEFDLVDELERVAEQVDDLPTVHEMNTQGRTGAATYIQRFGSWEAALELLEGDEEPDDGTGSSGTASSRYSDEELLDAVRSLAEPADGMPTTTEMDRSGAVASGTVIERFGSWGTAVERAGVSETETESPTEETEDGGSGSPGRMKMLMDLLEMKQALGRVPEKGDVEGHSAHSVKQFVEEFGSWETAVDAVRGSESG